LKPTNSPAARFGRLRELVAAELRYEQQTHAHTLAAESILGRVQQSDCRYPVAVCESGRNALDQLLLTVRYEVSDDEVENDFEPGKPAAFFYLTDGEAKELPHQCYVEQVSPGALTVSVPGAGALQSIRSVAQQRLLGLQLGIDATSFRVMDEALQAAMTSRNETFLRLRSVLCGTAQPAFRTLPRLTYPWLNASQQDAVQRVVEAEETAIVHGPPGTGKTTTLVEAVIETLRRETQVMVCAPSNAAVDWISEQLSRRGVAVLRVGNPLRITTEMLDCTYERRYAAHPDYSELWGIRKLLRESRGGRSDQQQARLAKLRGRATELEIRINADLFDQARVVSCTLIGSANRVLDHRRFSTLFIDEAAQALEPACWAAILKCDRVIFSGDYQQLPPTVKSPEAARGGLGRTLMQQTAQAHPGCVSLLTVQYRMHRDIMDFSSRWFYGGRLRAAPEVADRLVSPIDTPLTWIDTSQHGFGERQSRTLSRSNSEEARLLIHTLRDYIETVGPARIADQQTDFGIISPYRAQVRLIRRLLKWQKYFRHLRHQITVNSVDGFQGQERDVIILSMVRDNEEGAIGFLGDLRRMNVAITRARMKLIIVGSAETLGRHRFYGELIDYVRRRGEFLAPPPEAQ